TDYAGEAALTLGDSRVEASGFLRDTLELDARFTPLDLADLLPDAAGTLRGTLQARGPRNAPDLEADLTGSGLRWGGYAATSVRAQGRLPWSRGGGTLVLDGSGVEAGVALDAVRIEASGAVEDLRFDAQARSEALGSLSLQGNARSRGGNW